MKEFEPKGWLVDVYQDEKDGEVHLIEDVFGNAFIGVFLDHEKHSNYSEEELVNTFRDRIKKWGWVKQ